MNIVKGNIKFYNYNILNLLNYIILFIFTMFFSVYAYAENTNNTVAQNAVNLTSTNIFQPVQNDMSIELLATLFGGMPFFGNGADGFQEVFKIFNISILTVGGVLAAYTIMLTSIGTAKEGEAMGRQYDTTWIPIRYVAGVGTVLPVINGYCAIQVIIMWFIIQGIGIADIVWQVFTSEDNLKGSLAVSPVTPNAKELAKNTLQATLCVKALAYQSAMNGDDLTFGITRLNMKGGELSSVEKELVSKAGVDASKDMKSTYLLFGEMNGANGIAKDACGSIEIKNFQEGRDGVLAGIDKSKLATEVISTGTNAYATMHFGNTTGKVVTGTAALFSGIQATFGTYEEKQTYKRWLKDISQGHEIAIEVLLTRADEISDAIMTQIAEKDKKEFAEYEAKAKKVLEQNPDKNISIASMGDVTSAERTIKKTSTVKSEDIAKEIDGLASTYQNAIKQIAVSRYKDGVAYSELVKASNQSGWIMAGAFHNKMADITDAVNKMVLEVPASQSNPVSPNALKVNELNSKYLSVLNDYYGQTSNYSSKAEFVKTVDKPVGDDKMSWKKFGESGFSPNYILDNMMTSAIDMSINDNEHPIIQLKRLGSLMIATAGATLTSTMAILDGENGGEAGTMWLIATFAYTLVVALLSGGITLTYILPMLPFFIWMGMVFGWVVLVVQAVIAGPIIMIMHLTPNAQDLMGQQRQGYNLVFSLILRPLLMVLGVIATIILINVLGIFINKIFTTVYMYSQTSEKGLLAGIFGLLIVPIMYAVFVYIMLKEILSIMYKVPDELLSWIGSNGTALGSYAQQVSGNSTQVIGGIAQQSIRPTENMRNAVREMKDLNIQQANFDTNQKEAKSSELRNRQGNFNNTVDNLSASIGGGSKARAASDSINNVANSVADGHVKPMNRMDNENFQDAMNEEYKYNQPAFQEALNQELNNLASSHELNKNNENYEPPTLSDVIANARERANDNLYGDSGNFARKVVGGIDAYNHKSGDIYERNGDTMNRQLSSVANKNNVPVSDVAERFANNLRNVAPNLSAKLENNENTMSHVKEFSNPSNPNFEANNAERKAIKTAFDQTVASYSNNDNATNGASENMNNATNTGGNETNNNGQTFSQNNNYGSDSKWNQTYSSGSGNGFNSSEYKNINLDDNDRV